MPLRQADDLEIRVLGNDLDPLATLGAEIDLD
jgi:hypothetical protein